MKKVTSPSLQFRRKRFEGDIQVYGNLVDIHGDTVNKLLNHPGSRPGRGVTIELKTQRGLFTEEMNKKQSLDEFTEFLTTHFGRGIELITTDSERQKFDRQARNLMGIIKSTQNMHGNLTGHRHAIDAIAIIGFANPKPKK